MNNTLKHRLANDTKKCHERKIKTLILLFVLVTNN